jgi:hypothetical protein
MLSYIKPQQKYPHHGRLPPSLVAWIYWLLQIQCIGNADKGFEERVNEAI